MIFYKIIIYLWIKTGSRSTGGWRGTTGCGFWWSWACRGVLKYTERRGVDTQGEVDTPYEVVAPWGVEFLLHDESASLMLFFISGSRHKNSVIDMDNKKIFIKIVYVYHWFLRISPSKNISSIFSIFKLVVFTFIVYFFFNKTLFWDQINLMFR